MWPFKRKQSDQSTIPAEVEEYYQSERRERVGVAWLLAFATLVTTLLVAVGLFFGGRALYRQFTKDDKPKPVAVTPAIPKPSAVTGPTLQPAQPSSPQQPTNPQSGNKQPQTPAAADSETPDVEDPDTELPAMKTPTTPTPSKPTTPSTPLPKTGPTETLSVFVSVTTIATLGHYCYTKRKLMTDR